MTALSRTQLPIQSALGFVALAAVILNPMLGVPLVAFLALAAVSLVAPVVPLSIFVIVVYTNLSEVATDVYYLPPIGGLLAPALLFLLLLRAAAGLETLSQALRLVPFAVIYILAQTLPLMSIDNPGPTISELSNITKNLIILLILLGFVTSMRRLHWITAAAGAGIAVIAALSVFQYLTGTFYSSYGGFANAFTKQISVGASDSWRLAGPLPDPNFFGQVLVIGLPMVLSFVFVARSRLFRLLALAGAGFIFLAIFFTFSRGALLGIAAMVGAAILTSRRRTLLLTSLGLVSVVVLMVMPASYLDRIDTIFQAVGVVLKGGQVITDPALAERLTVVHIALAMFTSHPVTGIGVGQFSEQFSHFALGNGRDLSVPPEAHSIYLEALAEGGLIKLSLLVGVMIWGLLVGAKTQARLRASGARADAALIRGLILSLIGYSVTAIFLHGDYERFMWVGLALLLSTEMASRAPNGALPSRQMNWRKSMSSEVQLLQNLPQLVMARKWIIAGCTALGLAAGIYGVSQSPREYAAETTLLYRFGREYFPVMPGEQRREWGENILVSLDNALFTEMRLFTSEAVFREALTQVNPRTGAPVLKAENIISAARVEGATMIEVSARNTDPRLADELLEAQIAAYLEARERIFNVDAKAFYDEEIAARSNERSALESERQSLLASFGGGAAFDDAAPMTPERAEMSERLNEIETALAGIAVEVGKLTEERANAVLSHAFRTEISPAVEQVDKHYAAGNPIGASPIMKLAISTVMGVVAGLLYILAAASLSRVQEPEESDYIKPVEPLSKRKKQS